MTTPGTIVHLNLGLTPLSKGSPVQVIKQSPMVPLRPQPAFIRGNATLRSRTNRHRDARLRLRYKLLEPRHLLASDLLPRWCPGFRDRPA